MWGRPPPPGVSGGGGGPTACFATAVGATVRAATAPPPTTRRYLLPSAAETTSKRWPMRIRLGFGRPESCSLYIWRHLRASPMKRAAIPEKVSPGCTTMTACAEAWLSANTANAATQLITTHCRRVQPLGLSARAHTTLYPMTTPMIQNGAAVLAVRTRCKRTAPEACVD